MTTLPAPDISTAADPDLFAMISDIPAVIAATRYRGWKIDTWHPEGAHLWHEAYGVNIVVTDWTTDGHVDIGTYTDAQLVDMGEYSAMRQSRAIAADMAWHMGEALRFADRCAAARPSRGRKYTTPADEAAMHYVAAYATPKATTADAYDLIVERMPELGLPAGDAADQIIDDMWLAECEGYDAIEIGVWITAAAAAYRNGN